MEDRRDRSNRNQSNRNRSNNSNNNRNRGNNQSNNNQNRGNNNNGNNRNSNSSNRSGNRRDNNNNNANNNNRIRNEDPCPLPGHGNHTWGNCRYNHFGSNYNNNRNNNNTNNNWNNNESNHNQAQSSGQTNGQSNSNGSNSVTPTPNTQFQFQGNNQGSSNYFSGSEYCQPCDPTPNFFDNPDCFFSNDELEPEQYDNVADDTTNQNRTSDTVIHDKEEDKVPSTLALSRQINEKKENTSFVAFSITAVHTS